MKIIILAFKSTKYMRFFPIRYTSRNGKKSHIHREQSLDSSKSPIRLYYVDAALRGLGRFFKFITKKPAKVGLCSEDGLRGQNEMNRNIVYIGIPKILKPLYDDFKNNALEWKKFDDLVFKRRTKI